MQQKESILYAKKKQTNLTVVLFLRLHLRLADTIQTNRIITMQNTDCNKQHKYNFLLTITNWYGDNMNKCAMCTNATHVTAMNEIRSLTQPSAESIFLRWVIRIEACNSTKCAFYFNQIWTFAMWTWTGSSSVLAQNIWIFGLFYISLNFHSDQLLLCFKQLFSLNFNTVSFTITDFHTKVHCIPIRWKKFRNSLWKKSKLNDRHRQ